MTTTQENSNSSCETVIVQSSSSQNKLSTSSKGNSTATILAQHSTTKHCLSDPKSTLPTNKQLNNGTTTKIKQPRLSRNNQQRNKDFSHLRHQHRNQDAIGAIPSKTKCGIDVEARNHHSETQTKVEAANESTIIDNSNTELDPSVRLKPQQQPLSNLGQMKQFLVTYLFNMSPSPSPSPTTATTNNNRNKCKSVPVTPIKNNNINQLNNNINAHSGCHHEPTKTPRRRRYLSWFHLFGADSRTQSPSKTMCGNSNSNKLDAFNLNSQSNSSGQNSKANNSDKQHLHCKNIVKIVVETSSKEVQTECPNGTDSNMQDAASSQRCKHLNGEENNNKHSNNNNEPSGDSKEKECPMSTEKFREHGRNLIDYISDYLDTIGKRRVTPLNIEPGYLRSLLDVDAPKEGEKFEEIMKDFENHIMCGITHWQHPRFHAYFPAGNAYPSILADILSDAIGCVGFSWAASPACTELEIIMLDWMGKMIGLPEEFLCLSGAESKGGGVIQGSASECVLVNLLAARHVAIDKLRKKYPQTSDGVLLSKLIGYCSKEAHSCVEKAAMIGFIKMRALETDDKYSLRGEILARAIKQDKQNGLEPFLVSATLGTTSCCSFDNLEEVGKVCQEHDIWLHVDAAYAGSALICPEFKYLMKGIELATSFNMNPNKWMLINFDCSLMWVKDRFQLTRAFVVDPLYLQHSFSDKAIDYRHWGIPLSRRFRALKLWFVIRNYGVEGLQKYIRNHVRLAKRFEELIRADSRFEIINKVVLGLVCFRLAGSNALNQRLLSNINASGKLHMVPASLNGRYIIRFCVCAQEASEKDIIHAYQCISEFANELFESIRAGRERIRAVSQQNTIDVSDISLHTQQSASADLRVNTNQQIANHQNIVIGAAATATGGSQVEASYGANNQIQPSTGSIMNGGLNSSDDLIRAKSVLSAGNTSMRATTCSPGSARTSPMITAQQLHQQQQQNDHQQTSQLVRGASNKLSRQQQQTNNNDTAVSIGEIDDLEEEIILDDPSLLDDMEDDEDLGVLLLSDEESKCANEAEEAVDEVFTLEKRNRMSLRYKRGFFVRVVSDPKMYRVSISGDIGDSSGSIGSASGS